MGTTKVRLPPSLLYPVEVVELLTVQGADVKKHQPLVKFKYWNRVPDGVSDEGEEAPLVTKEFYGIFESPFDGKLTARGVTVGDRINDSDTTVFEIVETCDHSVQYGGLCALCGASLDEKDYMGYSDTDRAPIAMSHDTSGLTVSRQEAERIETRSTERLLADRRLILVVDLDQTVIHAAVNPEIGRWLDDPDSPNHDLVEGVRRFSLKERIGPGNREQVSWYYVKLRPGLKEFLDAMNSKYEMHIYTMATKAYATEIAKIIDPTGEYFGDRILSRDASGNVLHKDLKRLFPVSTSMVTIIDDRGDVWNWIPNLLRVIPYHFWSGTGDINSQFLPKRDGLVTPDQVADDSTQAEQAAADDVELETVQKALDRLHTQFYRKHDENLPADVGKLLPALKSLVFDGCVILFSGFFPLGTDLDNADIVQWVRSFGAIVVSDYLPAVTHVVAKTSGTTKARLAAGHHKAVVRVEWVFACLEHWQRVPEKPYLMSVADPIKQDTSAPNDSDDEMDKNIAEGFVRSLTRGELNWDEMNEELKEFLSDEELDEEPVDEAAVDDFAEEPANAQAKEDVEEAESFPNDDDVAVVEEIENAVEDDAEANAAAEIEENTEDGKHDAPQPEQEAQHISKKRKRDENLDLDEFSKEFDGDWD